MRAYKFALKMFHAEYISAWDFSINVVQITLRSIILIIILVIILTTFFIQYIRVQKLYNIK